MGARLNLDNNQTPPALGLDGTPNNLFGQMDDFGLWNRVLAPDEINKVYTAGKAGQGLTTVKLTPPVVTTPGKLGVSAKSGNVTITWDNGKLQSATVITGPWTDVANAASPFSEAVGATPKFFRTVGQ